MTTRLRAACLAPLLAGILLPAGCSGRPSRAEHGLGPARHAVPVPPGRRCEYLSAPEALPPRHELLGLGFLGNLSLWGHGGSPGDTLELSIRYGDDARLDWVRSVRRGPELARITELQRMLRQALPDRVRIGWGVRLLISGDGRLIGLLPSVVCRAEAETTSYVPRPMAASEAERAEMQRARGRTFEVHVALDEDGRVVGASLARSTSSRALDQYFIDVVRATRFSPLLHDGLPVPSTETFRLTVPRRHSQIR